MNADAIVFQQGERVPDWLITQSPNAEDSVRGELVFRVACVVTSVEGFGHYVFTLDGRGTPFAFRSVAEAVTVESIGERVFLAATCFIFDPPAEGAAA